MNQERSGKTSEAGFREKREKIPISGQKLGRKQGFFEFSRENKQLLENRERFWLGSGRGGLLLFRKILF
jgi:hypothetical protein